MILEVYCNVIACSFRIHKQIVLWTFNIFKMWILSPFGALWHLILLQICDSFFGEIVVKVV